MEDITITNCSTATGCSAEEADIWRDILAQAVTGELVAALNYDALAALTSDPEESAEAREHADRERAHAEIFAAAGRRLGFDVRGDVEAPYWRRIRSAFLSHAQAGDFIGCIVAQEVMLESFATASYGRIGEVAPGELGATFAAISGEECEHVDHSIALLRAERARDPRAFDDKVHEVHEEIMTALAEMVAREDRRGHCGLCRGNCVKPSLPRVRLSTSDLRGLALRSYLKTLDEIGLPGETTLAWVAQLPV